MTPAAKAEELKKNPNVVLLKFVQIAPTIKDEINLNRHYKLSS